MKIPLQLNSEKNNMFCQRIALFVAIFGTLLSSEINGSTLPPPVDEIVNKTTIAPDGEFEYLGWARGISILGEVRSAEILRVIQQLLFSKF